LSVVSVVAITASVATFAVAYAIGGSGAIEDNWVALLVTAMAFGPGLVGSLAAFVLAIVAKIKHERWARLWLPLCTFPAFLAFLVLGELFWWE
jgi:phosphoglycerol transferase MdoB-like AlkP superfamily enzyme